jgi:hypothetical protein
MENKFMTIKKYRKKGTDKATHQAKFDYSKLYPISTTPKKG